MLAEVGLMYKVIFLFCAGFIASFVDSIAGGGGLISIPAYFMVGFEPHYMLGTNKLSSSSGAVVSSLNFYKSGKVNFEVLKYMLPFTLLGAGIGVYTVLGIDPKVLKPLVLVLLLGVGLNTILSKDIGLEDNYKGPTKKNIMLGCILALATGFYDGFFGPGTGSLIIFGLLKVFKFDFVRASGNSKIMNLTSNLFSLILFAIKGKIHYILAIPVIIAMVLGGMVGSRLAIKEGTKLVKPIFIVITLAVALKMLYELVIGFA